MKQVIDTIFAAIAVHLGVSEADLKGLIAREPENFQDLAEAWARGYVIRKQGNGLLPAIIQAGLSRPDEASVVAFCDGFDLNDKSQEGVATIIKNGAYLLKVADKLTSYAGIVVGYNLSLGKVMIHTITEQDLIENPELKEEGVQVGEEVVLEVEAPKAPKKTTATKKTGKK